MKKFLFLLILFFSFTLSIDAYAEAYVVMDANSGRVLDSKNVDSKSLIASTTKIMTALVAIENANLNSIYTAGEEVKTVYGSMIYLDVGEEMKLVDLLYGLLFQSGNDAAMVIASNVMNYDDFIDAMNSKAYQIGMKNTKFENPHGLDDDTKNYSTAYDLALLMKYATKNKTFMEISGQKKYVMDSNVERHIWYNKNKLLSLYKFATGGKIGYTTASKHVFVSSAKKGEEELVIATIKDTDRFNTHKNFYERFFDEYDSYEILNKYTFSINDSNYKDCHLYIKNDFSMMVNDNEKDKVKLEIKLKKKNDVFDNDEVGYVEVFVGSKMVHSEPIFAVNKQSKINKLKNWLFFWR